MGSTGYIGTIISYNAHRQWCAVKYSDGTEKYSSSSSELALIYCSELIPSAFFMAFDLALPVAVALHDGSLCAPLIVPSGVASVALCSLMGMAAYSIDAQDHLGSGLVCLVHAKPLNPIFPWLVSHC